MRKSVRVLSLVPVIALAVWSTPPAGGSQRTDSSRSVEDKDPEAEDRILTPSEAELAHWLEVNGDTQVQSAAQALPDLELALGGPGFGGMRWESPGKLHVMVVGDERSAARSKVKAWATAIPNTEVTTSYVRHAYSDLEAVAAEMPGVVEQLAGRGQLESAAVRVEDNVVEVAVLERSAGAIADALAKRYGSVVRVVTAKELSEPADRRDDSTPYYGGVALWPSSTSNPRGVDAYCTMGYAWRLWTTSAIVGSTAGHCLARNQVWWNATSAVGTVTHRAWANGPYDAEFITPPTGSSFNPRVWVGGPATATSWPVVGAVEETSAWIGSPIVVSGANGGETRGTVTAVNATVCYFSGPCITGVTRFRVTQGGIIGGDSGGPCFSSASGMPATVIARGTITGPRDRFVGDESNCVPVVDTSAALGGSIYTS